MRRRQELTSEERGRIWHVVYDSLAVDGDHVAAKQAADLTASALDQYRERNEQYERETRSRERKHAFAVFASWLAGLAALAGAGTGAWWLTTLNDHDYAGYGPHKADDHAVDAVRGWYGENDAPARLVPVSQKRTTWDGHDAWKVTFKAEGRPGYDELVCAYVWKGDADAGEEETPDEVFRGQECLP